MINLLTFESSCSPLNLYVSVSLQRTNPEYVPRIISYSSPPVIELTLYARGRDTFYKVPLQGEEQNKGGNHRQRGHRQSATPIGYRPRVADERAQGPRHAENRRIG